MTTFTRSDWQKGYQSQTQEYSYWIEGVEGQIPFEGTLFRNGPGSTRSEWATLWASF
jgi:all-trans-8'-apo-beta-carotenal 15,15'-oxygenase